MADIIKQDMSQLWASSGDIVKPDDTKIQTGWIVEIPPRELWNWFENRQDSNIAYILQKGITEWDETTEYLANRTYVQRNGVLYKALLTGTNKDPLTEPTYWRKAFVDYTDSLSALSTTTAAADKVPYFTSSSAASTTTLTAFARTILDDVDASAVRVTINAQTASVTLSTLASVTPENNKIPYFTGATTASSTTLTAFARTLLDDNDAATARGTLGADNASNLISGTVPNGRLSGTYTGASIGGNAATATKLATTRTINGVNFDGTAPITILADPTTKTIVASTDLDTITTPGKYSCPADVTAATLINSPTVSAFTMDVSSHAGTRQELSEYLITNPKTWMRNLYSGSWGTWYRVYSSADPQPIPAALPITGGTLTGPLVIAPNDGGSGGVGTSLVLAPETGNAGIEIGRQVDGLAQTPYIDFHSGTVATDYDSRIIGSMGDGTNGGGNLTYTAYGQHLFNGPVVMTSTLTTNSNLAATGGTITTNRAFQGDYGLGTSGSLWGQTIWGMGPAYVGGPAAATGYDTAGLYGLAWHRGTSGDTQVNEGVYVYQTGVFKGGIGSGGIKTTGVFYGNGSGITNLNAGNLVGTVPNAAIFDGGWVNISYVNSFVTQSGGVSLRYRRTGNLVTVTGTFQRATQPSNLMTIGTVPVGFRPDIVSVNFTGTTSTDSPLQFNEQGFSISVNGTISVGIISGVAGSTWKGNFTVTYPVP